LTSKGERLLRDPVFSRLKVLAIQRTGLAYWSDKDEAFADTLAPVLEQRGLSPAQLVARLGGEYGHGPETEALIDAVTVSETFFFRDREQFDALERQILPDIMARNRETRTLALWSAGCSNGAEPYSLSILLKRAFGMCLSDWRKDILGTDISHTSIAEAQAGLYGAWTMRDLPPELHAACFAPISGKWRLKPVYRKGVRFLRHNLTAEPPPMPLAGNRFDLIICRNVLMYFDGDTRERVLTGFHGILAEGGWLMVSHAEAGPQLAEHFDSVALPSGTLYRKPLALKAKASPTRVPVIPAPSGPLLPEADPEALAQALLDQGAFSRAVALCRAWVDLNPMDPAPHYYLGLALEPLSEEQAIAALRRALFLAPHLALAHFHLLRLFQRRGDHRQARRHYVAVMADLAELPDDHKLPMANSLTAGELVAIARRLGERP
jgi:chemotaxis protein methyltransferase CheR